MTERYGTGGSSDAQSRNQGLPLETHEEPRDALYHRPLIAVTSGHRRAWWEGVPFRIALFLAGGRYLRLFPGSTVSPDEVDGLILSGGRDISPRHARGKAKPGYRYNHRRDELELWWVSQARGRNMPVLGVCRGAQLMAVSHDGTLHHAVRTAYRNARYPRHPLTAIYFRKAISLHPDSLIHRIIRAAALKVNSLHSQAIRHAGRGMIVTAREENGVIQTIEDPASPFYIGVQFHPELMIYRRRFRDIFVALVQAARVYRRISRAGS
ncbi:MAG: gamma-glutamyl-gamma-aminobutyrate hydrolase family protein [Alkalispirochaeta sp.]